MSIRLKYDDPALWMLREGVNDPSKRSKTTVFSKNCFICLDEQFSLMELPLCYPCSICKGHVPADDVICSVCKHDQMSNKNI